MDIRVLSDTSIIDATEGHNMLRIELSISGFTYGAVTIKISVLTYSEYTAKGYSLKDDFSPDLIPTAAADSRLQIWYNNCSISGRFWGFCGWWVFYHVYFVGSIFTVSQLSTKTTKSWPLENYCNEHVWKIIIIHLAILLKAKFAWSQKKQHGVMKKGPYAWAVHLIDCCVTSLAKHLVNHCQQTEQCNLL